MRCLPDQTDFPDGHHAEKALWDTLRAQLPHDVVLAHSVHVRHGRAEHEFDVLVLWPGVGLAAIEVKGGRITVENGKWYQSDDSTRRSLQSPVPTFTGGTNSRNRRSPSETPCGSSSLSSSQELIKGNLQPVRAGAFQTMTGNFHEVFAMARFQSILKHRPVDLGK